MRGEPTEYEKRLRRCLSNAQLGGYKFRRQAAIPPFIADFSCLTKGLIVQVDGETHIAEADAKREALLPKRGFTTIRFSNDEVRDNMDGVLIAIVERLSKLPDRRRAAPASPTPNPSPEGEGLA
ncbi:MAG TPA: endonuclease domain-containing protein [Allosphingosinicella sp.]|nr:endonuclease domain-containing protein [Allosphingosinicella sp.]